MSAGERRGRPPTGGIRERRRAGGRTSFLARFTDQRGTSREILVGTSPRWSREEADLELQSILARVRDCTWRPPEPELDPEEERRDPDPSLHELASDWLHARGVVVNQHGRPITHEKQELSTRSQEHILWALRGHLLPALGRQRVTTLTPQRIDGYRAAKLKEGKLAAAQVNRTLAVLAQILDLAVDYSLLTANPARGPRRRARVGARSRNRSWLDFDQLTALLDGAQALDEGAHRRRDRHTGRRAILAVLFLAGLRVGEACALHWRDVDLSREIISVRDSKTPAGVRTVPIGAMLLEELKPWSDRARGAADKPPGSMRVFSTSTGKPRDRHNVRQRVLAPAVRRANERRGAGGTKERDEALPAITSHSGRRTAISWWLEAEHPIRRVQAWAGHEDARLTLSIYAQVSAQPPDERIKAAAAVSWLRAETDAAREGA